MNGKPGVVADYLDQERKRMPREVLELAVLGAFRRGVLSAGKSSEILEIPLAAFFELASREGIPILDATEEELAADLRSSHLPSRP